jgi:hypothetical protein
VTRRSRVCLFVCGRTDYRALSLDKRGRNLPPCLTPPHTWTRVDEIRYAPDTIQSLEMDPTVAMENLKARGYHIVRSTPQMIASPEAGKRRY